MFTLQSALLIHMITLCTQPATELILLELILLELSNAMAFNHNKLQQYPTVNTHSVTEKCCCLLPQQTVLPQVQKSFIKPTPWNNLVIVLATTICCCQTPQNLRGYREVIGSWTSPQFAVALIPQHLRCYREGIWSWTSSEFIVA